MTRYRFLMLLLLTAWTASSPRLFAQSTEKIRVACVGDSITFGAGIKPREKFSYPAQLQGLLGEPYEVKNFGVSGRTMLRKGDFPYWKEKAYAQALAFDPNIVVIKLGTNDSKPQNWKYKDEFAGDTKALVASFRERPSHPRVLLCLPVPAFELMWGINPGIIQKETIPLLRQVAFDLGAEPVDLYTAHLGKSKWFPDHIHPDATGAGSIARLIAAAITLKTDGDYDIGKQLAARGITPKVSSFYGYRCLDFQADGRACKVVRPCVTAAGRPYAWRAEFFGHEPQTDLALLQNGFHVVYLNTQNMLGAPAAMTAWKKFHDRLRRAGLSGKITLIAMSRGGLYAYHWAARHPETVGCMYGDAPVCDLKSWPGGKGQGKGSKGDWALAMKVYGFKNEAEALAFKGNPVDILAPLAQAKIPILHVVGLADTTVPVAENTDVLEQRYKALGGTIEVIRKPGVDHHPHSLENPEPIVKFIMEHGLRD